MQISLHSGVNALGLFLKVVLNSRRNDTSSDPYSIFILYRIKYLPLSTMKAQFTLLFSLLFLIACQQYEEDLLSGNWQGSAILEADQPLGIEPSDITLMLKADGSYRYASTLNYKEAGTFYLEEQYLYTMDTLNQASTEKAVEIVLLSPDSLHIRMNEGGKERLLKMTRQ